MPWEAGPIWNCGACEGELHWMLHTHHAQLARVRAHLDASTTTHSRRHQQQQHPQPSVHLAGISLKTQELYVIVFCARYRLPSGTTTLPTTHYPLPTTYRAGAGSNEAGAHGVAAGRRHRARARTAVAGLRGGGARAADALAGAVPLLTVATRTEATTYCGRCCERRKSCLCLLWLYSTYHGHTHHGRCCASAKRSYPTCCTCWRGVWPSRPISSRSSSALAPFVASGHSRCGHSSTVLTPHRGSRRARACACMRMCMCMCMCMCMHNLVQYA